MRFIHKNMVDATVEFIEHPLRHFRVGEQVTRFQNEIVKIKPTARLFAGFIPLEERGSEAIEFEGFLNSSKFEP